MHFPLRKWAAVNSMQGEFHVGQEWSLYSSWKTVRYLIDVHQQTNASEAEVQNLYHP